MTTLTILFLLAHWACDFTQLSRPYMLQAKKFGTPLMPIFHHALLHGLSMGIITFFAFFNPISALLVFSLITIVHFAIDTAKGRVNALIPITQNPTNVYHWWVFGFDQFLHILTIIMVIKLIK